VVEGVNLFVVLGAAPGVMALIAAAISHGKLMQRVLAVEETQRRMADAVAAVAAIDERTKNSARQITDIKAQVDKLVDRMLDERRR